MSFQIRQCKKFYVSECFSYITYMIFIPTKVKWLYVAKPTKSKAKEPQ